MTDEFRHDTPPIPPLPQLPATTEADNPLDLPDSFDPADYDWHPVARRKRRDGWTHARQRAFVEALSDTGSVRDAAEAAGMTRKSCYALRRSPGGGAFAAAWDAAIDEASKQLVDIAFERAVKGVADPVFDRHGACIAVRRRYNDRLLMFLLRAHQPERYRYAHGDLRHAEEGASAPAQPVARAIDMLSPPPPENVAALMPPRRTRIAHDLCRTRRWRTAALAARYHRHHRPDARNGCARQ